MLCLLGTPRHPRHAVPLERSTLLVAVLACADDWMSREAVMSLLWPEADLPTAQGRLRQLLHRARRFEYFAGLQAERTRLRFAAETDVALFRRACAAGRWRQAAELYGGELLGGMGAAEPDLQAWLETEREALRRAFVRAALSAADALPGAEALALLRPAALREPLEAELVRAALGRAAASPAAARQVFEAHAAALRELGEEPEAGLGELLAQAERGAGEPLRAVPVPADALIGRQAELEALAGLFAGGARLVTLLGVGGVGKTRLALEFAHKSGPPGGAAFVALAGLGRGDEVAGEVLKALGAIPGDDPPSQLEALLARRELLLVLDNFEHLTEAAPLVARLLGAAPRLRVLVTSREALGLSAEHLLELDGLPAPDDLFPLEAQEAAALFEREARRVAAGFALRPDDLGALRRIHRAVSGSPLGLRLAAGLTRLLSPGEIAAELEAGLEVLSASPAPDLPERHQGLGAVFQTSWARLSDPERRALARLSVLRGGFEAALARQVAETSTALLLRLVNKSLVSRREGRLYLHEAVRQYAQARLGGAESEAAHERLLGWAEALAERTEAGLYGPDEQAVVQAALLEFDHLRTAVLWGLERRPRRAAAVLKGLSPFLLRHGQIVEAGGWLRRLLGSGALAGDRLEGWAAWAEGLSLRVQSRFEEAQARAEAALRLARAFHDPALEARSHQLLGLCAGERLDYAAATAHFEAGGRIAAAHSLSALEAVLCEELGAAHAWAGRPQEAHRTFERAYALHVRLGSRQGLAVTMTLRAAVFGRQGDLQTEQAWLAEALPHLKAGHNVRDLYMGLSHLFVNAVRRGALEEGRGLLEEIDALTLRHGLTFPRIYLLSDYAHLEHALGRHARAALLLFACQHLLRRHGAGYDWYLTAETLRPHLGQARLAELERRAAFLSLEAAFEVAHGGGDVPALDLASSRLTLD